MYPVSRAKRITNDEIYRSKENLKRHTKLMLQLYDNSSSPIVFIYGQLARRCFISHLHLDMSKSAVDPRYFTLRNGRTLVLLPHPECMSWARPEILAHTSKILPGINHGGIVSRLGKYAETVEKDHLILDDDEQRSSRFGEASMKEHSWMDAFREARQCIQMARDK